MTTVRSDHWEDIKYTIPNLYANSHVGHALSKSAVEPDVIKQLRVWAVELAEKPIRQTAALPKKKVARF